MRSSVQRLGFDVVHCLGIDVEHKQGFHAVRSLGFGDISGVDKMIAIDAASAIMSQEQESRCRHSLAEHTNMKLPA